MSNVANAATMLKCKPTGMDSESKTVMQIQFNEGKDFGHPSNVQASITSGKKTMALQHLHDSNHDWNGFFLIDAEGKRNYFVSRKTIRSVITVDCTEPKSLGMLLPCTGDTTFKCSKVSGF